jgi:TetR/AcrR family transcriptional repressor of lmrAB and yxaGH operons
VLYHHFPGGKASLGVAAIELSARIFNEVLTAAAAQASDPRSYIIAIGELTAADLLETRFEAGCPLATVALETAPADPELANACRVGFELWLETMETQLSALGHKSPRACAELLLTSLEGALAVARTQKDVTIVRTVASRVAEFA